TATRTLRPPATSVLRRGTRTRTVGTYLRPNGCELGRTREGEEHTFVYRLRIFGSVHGSADQQVTCRIAFVSFGSASNARIASGVGTVINSTARRAASCFTSSITGRAPSAPVPTTRRRQSQGMFSSMDTGVWPKASRKGLDDFFLRLRT